MFTGKKLVVSKVPESFSFDYLFQIVESDDQLLHSTRQTHHFQDSPRGVAFSQLIPN